MQLTRTPLQRGRSAPELFPALDVENTTTASGGNIHDFQAASLRVFQSKKLWSEFQAELKKENVTHPSAVKVKLRQFISERKDELLLVDVDDEDESHTVANTQELGGRRNSVFDMFNNIFNTPLDRSYRSCDNLDEEVKNGLLGRFALENRRSISDVDDSDSTSLWMFSKLAAQEENNGNKRVPFFKSWRKESCDSNDFTAEVTSSIRRMSSNVSLGSLTSLASEIGESRRKDLVDDFYETQLKKLAASDDSLIDKHVDYEKRRASIDLNERPMLYTSRIVSKFDSSPLQFENDDQSQQDDQWDDEDDDRSNNGAFEFPSASRRIYLARSSFVDGSSCDLSIAIDKEHSTSMNVPVIDNTSMTGISHISNSERSITSEGVSKLQPKLVRKRMSWNLLGPKSGGAFAEEKSNGSVLPSNSKGLLNLPSSNTRSDAALAADSFQQHNDVSQSSDGLVFKQQVGSQDYPNRASRVNESKQPQTESTSNEEYNDSMSTLSALIDPLISDEFKVGYSEDPHYHNELDFVKLLESHTRKQDRSTNSSNIAVNFRRQEILSGQISTYERNSPTSASFLSDGISCSSDESDMAVVWPH